MISELLWEFIALQKPRYDEPCSIIFSDLCSGKVYSSCTAVLQLRVITQFSANRRWATEVIFAAIQLMISSSSLWLILNPSFFPGVDISAAVCDAQRVGSWPYKVMSALTRAGLMTLSLSPSWHYYHSQAQARDITPKTLRIRITVGEKWEKELCLFLPQFTAAFRGSPYLITQCTVAILCTVWYTIIPEHWSVIMMMTPDSLTPSPPPSTILILRRIRCRGETRSCPKQSWSASPHLLSV